MPRENKQSHKSVANNYIVKWTNIYLYTYTYLYISIIIYMYLELYGAPEINFKYSKKISK